MWSAGFGKDLGEAGEIPALSRNRVCPTQEVGHEPDRRALTAPANRRGMRNRSTSLRGRHPVRILRLERREPPVRASFRAAVTALVIAGTTLIGACAPAITPSPSAQSRRSAADWLVRQFSPTTHVIESATTPGQPDVGGTAYAVTSLRIANIAGSTQLAAMAALAPHVDSFVKDTNGIDQPGQLARLILAVVATGGNPHAYGGTDLVARLEATMATTGPDTGRFGVQDATYDGAFRQGLALAALSVVTPTPAAIDPGAGSIDALPAVAWLRAQQCADGSWMPYRANLAIPCAFDPITFSGPDSNSTSMATLGLTAVEATSVSDPNGWFTTTRTADGGWGYDGSSTADPDSTSLVMAARRALGITPDATAITKLRSFQFDSAAPAADRGAYFYPPWSGPALPNLLATNDAVVGLAPGVWPAILVP